MTSGLSGQFRRSWRWLLTIAMTLLVTSPVTMTATAQLSAPLLPAEERIPVIVLDPGRGGTDHGAKGPTGLLEKELTLQVATDTGRLIEGLLGWRVHLTRADDTSVPLETRAAFANELGADLFISIHAGGALAPVRRDFQVFFFDEWQGSAPPPLDQSVDSERFDQVGMQPGGGGAPPKPVPWDRAQVEFVEMSQTFARLLYRNLRAQVGDEGRGVFGLPILPLRWVRMPAVLLDLGSLSDPQFADRLRDEAYVQRVALGIAQAVNDYQALRR